MGRWTGKDLVVYVNSMAASYAIGWSMETDAETVSRFGAGASMPDIGVVYDRKRGSFECEGDPSDGVQVTLLAGPVETSLLLHEISGVWTTIDRALITGSQSVSRGSKPMRRFSWVEISSD